jgi:hypothetical protein
MSIASIEMVDVYRIRRYMRLGTFIQAKTVLMFLGKLPKNHREFSRVLIRPRASGRRLVDFRIVVAGVAMEAGVSRQSRPFGPVLAISSSDNPILSSSSSSVIVSGLVVIGRYRIQSADEMYRIHPN